jgi:hypothetical protein
VPQQKIFLVDGLCLFSIQIIQVELGLYEALDVEDIEVDSVSSPRGFADFSFNPTNEVALGPLSAPESRESAQIEREGR